MTTAKERSAFLPPHPDYITVGLLGSGYAAIHMRWYDGYYDVQETGDGRFAMRKAAVMEATEWARSEEIELRV